MADIVCVPVCSKCHNIINFVDFRDVKNEVENTGVFFYNPEIYPDRCVKCGEVFTNIIVPSKFPINMKDYLEEGISRGGR